MLYPTSVCNLILEDNATKEDEQFNPASDSKMRLDTNFSLKFPFSLQIPLGDDLKSGIQIRTNQVTRGWWNVERASGFSLQIHSKRW